jgi:hypothetical protein
VMVTKDKTETTGLAFVRQGRSLLVHANSNSPKRRPATDGAPKLSARRLKKRARKGHEEFIVQEQT